jgi:hypothetical protein
LTVKGFPTIASPRAAEVTIAGVEVFSEAILGIVDAGGIGVDQRTAALCACILAASRGDHPQRTVRRSSAGAGAIHWRKSVQLHGGMGMIFSRSQI